MPRSALLQRQLRLQRFAATNLCRSMLWLQSVRGAAAARKALPSFTAGGGGVVSNARANSLRWRVSEQLGKPMALRLALSHRLGSPRAVLPNPSLEWTRTGIALSPRAGVVHHPPRGLSAMPARSPQLKR